ncbi:PTS sugar transporter subunit IIA [Mucilaginibacter lappiensis]|uniref:Mannose/fructose-specific phosphotransferase system component IIA n=1 Tax=Mucilaginibacter lappiensis TaxID=354630 RepID=A0A841JNB3_9SPHI|nr:PTS fructose transporter subunit IIA [Mucilaginibacter lappiensis]MBB6131762.1 mannose/fructose-specific phosphotransferase system component IIA [Mucilaginibacter lappiensis]
MRKFLIATHGAFAQGIQSSVNMIIGETDNVFLIQAYLDDHISVEDELAAVLTHITADDELVIFTDLLGGSVNNIMMREALKDNVHIVSGFNLPLLIEVIMGDAGTPVMEVIEEAIVNAKEQMVYVNKLITQQND